MPTLHPDHFLKQGTDYSNFSSTPSENITQVTDAPDNYTLYALDSFLTDPTQFDLWLANCQRILDQKGLGRFINPDFDRPQTTDLPNAKRWYRISKDVQAWLQGNMSPEIYNMVERRGYDVQFADALTFQMKLLFRSTGYMSAKRNAQDLLRLKRSEYATASQYVSAFQSAYSKCLQRVNFTPFIAAVIVLDQVYPDISNWVDNKHSEFQKEFKDANNFSDDHLIILMNDIVDHLQTRETNPQLSAVANAISNKAT